MLTGMGSTGINAVTQYQGDKRMEDNTTKLVGGVAACSPASRRRASRSRAWTRT